jgi:uncharacterized membrane protein YphA (DoxX/SURF4 family)
MIAGAATAPRRRLLAPGLRALIALVLLATGTAKLLDMEGFAAIVAAYRAVPHALVVPAAWAVALGELGLAAWLISGAGSRPAALASAALHAAYMTWAATALARGLQIENCGCFGVFWGRPLALTTLLEDVALVALSLVLARAAGRA